MAGQGAVAKDCAIAEDEQEVKEGEIYEEFEKGLFPQVTFPEYKNYVHLELFHKGSLADDHPDLPVGAHVQLLHQLCHLLPRRERLQTRAFQTFSSSKNPFFSLLDNSQLPDDIQ